MPIVPALAPAAVPISRGFDYVAVDAARRRVYAAHTGDNSLLIVDADTGAVLGQVRVGPMHGVAVDPSNGHVFTGDGDDRSISEVDPVAMAVTRTVAVPGNVDAIAFDPSNRRIYADEDDGTRIFVIDATAMKPAGIVALPGHKPEYLTVDPRTHEVYQNISDRDEIAVVDPATLAVTRTIATPQIVANHPLQYDPQYGHLIVGGQNGAIAAYDRSGTLVGTLAIQPKVDQCNLDVASHEIACAGSGELTLVRDNPNGAPTLVGTVAIDPKAHTVAIDARTARMWIVYPTAGADDVVRSYAFER